jgi:hypothetical protein
VLQLLNHFPCKYGVNALGASKSEFGAAHSMLFLYLVQSSNHH